MRVENMESSSGNKIANQFIVYLDGFIDYVDGNKKEGRKCFQSYDSIIIFIDTNGKVTLDSHYWDYSPTTGKYRNLFLGEKKHQLRCLFRVQNTRQISIYSYCFSLSKKSPKLVAALA